MSTPLYAVDVLAKTGEAAKSGPMGFAIILVLCVACYFLFKSMSRHMKRVREQFPGSPGGDAPSASAPADPQPAAEQRHEAAPPASS